MAEVKFSSSVDGDSPGITGSGKSVVLDHSTSSQKEARHGDNTKIAQEHPARYPSGNYSRFSSNIIFNRWSMSTNNDNVSESAEIRKIWCCIYSGIFCLGLAGFLYGPILLANQVKDSSLDFLPENIRHFFRVNETLTLALRACSMSLLCLGTLVASCMCYRVRTVDTRDSCLRWFVLALTVASVLVGLLTGSVFITLLSIIGAFYVVHFAGKLPHGVTIQQPTSEFFTGTNETPTQMTTQQTSISSNMIIQPDSVQISSKKDMRERYVQLEAICVQMSTGIFVLSTGALVHGPLLLTNLAKDSSMDLLPEDFRLRLINKGTLVLSLRLSGITLITMATFLAAYQCYTIMRGYLQARVGRWLVLALTLVGVLVSCPVSAVGFIATSLLGASYFFHYAGKVAVITRTPKSAKISSASAYSMPLTTISAIID